MPCRPQLCLPPRRPPAASIWPARTPGNGQARSLRALELPEPDDLWADRGRPGQDGHGAGIGGAFLTLPFMGPHYVTSIFDHCSPDYATNGKICRYDGTIASASVGGPDPGF